MSITVSELLDLPHLQLRPWAATPAGLERAVTWAHVCELPDPIPWLEGGELLMTTGLAIPKEPDGQASYIASLARHGVSGLVVSDDLHAPPLDDRMRRAADVHDLPVLSVPLEVPFMAISRVVAAAAHESLRGRLLAQLKVLDTIRLAIRDNLDLVDLLRLIESRIGYRLYLVGSDGRRLQPDLPHPPEEIVARLWPRDGPMPARIAEGYVVTAPLSGRTPVHLLAIDDHGGAAEPAELSVVHHAATLAALRLERAQREREVLRREGAETLLELLSGSLWGVSARRRLELAGFDLDSHFRMLAIDDPEHAHGAEVHARLCEEAIPHLLVAQPDPLAMVPADAPVERLLTSSRAVRVGASSPFPPGGSYATARQEAKWALRRAVDSEQPFAAFEARSSSAGLLPRDPDLLRELVERVLGPLRDYDARRGTDLVGSLRTWLEHDRRVPSAAAALHVHEHTLRYRLGRVEDITGRRLSASRDLVELWLAFEALDLEG